MDSAQAIAHIEMLKNLWYASGNKFCHQDIRWCATHEPLPNKLGTYTAWPVIMDSQGVIGYMNEHGYGMNGEGEPSHPLHEMLGLRLKRF
jgi:hypothetical protein